MWQVGEAPFGFDFHYDTDMFATQFTQAQAQIADIFRLVGERQANDVGMPGSEFQVFEVPGAECWQIQFSVRQIDTFVPGELLNRLMRVGNANLQLLPVVFLNNARDAAIIETYALTRVRIPVDFRNGQGNHTRAHQLPHVIVKR